MEFTKDIYFDNSLTNGKTAKITYSGMLYKQGSENVNLVSGFGENWENTTTTPMQKIDNGFEVDIEIKDYDTFNFCFSNENNCWDNNNYFNYVSPILPAVEEIKEEIQAETQENVETAETNLDLEFDKLEQFMNEVPAENNGTIEFGADYSASIDDIIEDILGNTVQNSMSNDTESVDDILNSISQESMPEIEALFNELFFEEADDTVFDESAEIVSTPSDNAEIIELFDELFENAQKDISVEVAEIQEELNNAAAFSLDGLVDNLLEPVITAPVTNEDSIFENTENTITEETALVALNNDLQVSSRRLGFLYSLKKRISLACYKLFVKAPKEIAKQLGFYMD